MPTISILNVYNGYFRIPDLQMKISVTNNNQVFNLHHSTFFYASSVALTICYWRNHHIEAEYEAECIKTLSVIFVFKEISNRLKAKPPRRGQPFYKGQMVHPQCVLCSEVLLYCVHESHNEV